MSSNQEEGAPAQRVRGGRDVNVAGRDQLIITAGDNVSFHFEEPSGEGREVTASLIIAGDVPQQPPGFQSRVDLITALDSSELGVLVVRVLTGMRGVGKTQLAAAYARSKLTADWRLVAWINAQDKASLADDLASVAEAVGLPVKDGKDPGLAMRHWLEADGDRCLIVFDNVIDADTLRPYLPAGGKARVVITSNRISMLDLGEPLVIGVFTPQEAEVFLADRTGLADSAGAGELAAEVEFLPLALAQAAAVIRLQRLSYVTYIERLKALPVADYLTSGPGQPYPYGVAETVLLTLQAIESADNSGICGPVMWLLSVLSEAGVRRALLHIADSIGIFGGISLGAAAADEALGRLGEGSLLTFTLDSKTLIAHRLVLRVVRERLAKQRRLAEICQAAASMLGAYAVTTAESQDRIALRDFSEQVVALQQIMDGLPGGAGESEAVLLSLRWTALYFLNELGDSTVQAIALGEPLVEDCERVLGADHLDTMTSRGMLASVYQAAGKTADAVALNERTMAEMQRVLSPDDPRTLTARNNLANAYQAAGRRAEAMSLHEQTLADRERVLGSSHPDTLQSQLNLANDYQAAGRYEDAIAFYERTLAGYEEVQGPDELVTLLLRGNLATAYQSMGLYEDAIAMHERTLAAHEEVLGPDHPNTILSRARLTNTYQSMGRYGDAVTLFEQVLADSERVLGADHPGTLDARGSLAGAYQSMGRFGDAVTLFEQVLADSERVLGAEHPGTLASRHNLANTYQLMGRYEDAIPLYRSVLADHERLLGLEHPRSLTARSNLAGAYQMTDRVAEAIELHREILAARERVLGPDHPDTLITRATLASAYRTAGRRGEAIEISEQTLAARERLLGPDHPETLVSQNNLANLYQEAGRAAEAMTSHERTFAARERILGPDHPQTLTSASNVAAAYHAAGRNAEAKTLLEQVLNARKRALGPEHPDTLIAQNYLAEVERAADAPSPCRPWRRRRKS